MNFGHLHVHNEFSYLDGYGSAEAYAKRASELGQKYVALTNHGNIDGLIKFQSACKKQGITPVLGCEVYIVPDAASRVKEERRGHATLLVKNEVGWQNLCMMLTKANLDGFYYKPRIDYSTLLGHCGGLVVLTGCGSSFLKLPGGEQLLEKLKTTIDGDVYLEVMPHKLEDQYAINNLCLELSVGLEIPIVATNDCHYVLPGDCEIHEVLLAIQTKAKWNDRDRWRFEANGLYLRTTEEMRAAFREQGVLTNEEIDCALDWTEDVYDKCKFQIPKQPISLPKVPGYEQEDPGVLIWTLAEKRLLEIGQYWDSARVNLYFERLREEWRLIKEKGFALYFVIVWELVNWCRQNGIMVGPGRGSVGGSLLAYLLGITCVDPIRYGLLFSRFIAEDRIDLPDIDLDFEFHKRHLVREHLQQLYGKDHIASLSTFLTMKGRGTLRDVCRVFDVPLPEVDVFAKTIHESADSDKDAILEALQTEEGKKFEKKYNDLVKYMVALEGQVRGLGQHAAATIVSSEDLRSGTRGNLAVRSGELVCNWDMKDSEHVGLMKLDILGLNTLSVLEETRRQIVNGNSGKLFLYHPESECYFVGDELDISAGCDPTEFAFERVPLDDPKVYESIYNGETVGVFQLKTWASTKLARQIRAVNINELSDIIALVRPGPLDSGMTEDYITRKSSGAAWQRKHPIYEEITKETFGIVVYQEQVMDVIHKVAGLPYVTADKIRKVISKKRDPKEFQPYEDAFVAGCASQQTFSPKEAKAFWEALQAHARYSFNKSHSVEYAILGYWTAWAKLYYPVEFMCASLTYGDESEKPGLIEEAHRMGLEIVTPKVGVSDPTKWVAKDGKLYVPFREIKGIGEKMARKCAELKPAHPAIGNMPGLSGFFRPKNGSSDLIAKPKVNGKLDEILTNIGAYGNTPAAGLAEYFSFSIQPPANGNAKLKRLAGVSANISKMSTLQISRGDVQNAIKEISFEPKKTLSRCSACLLRKEGKLPVPPSPGNFNIAIIGEAPGQEEDEQGQGFVGRSGKMLWLELLKYGLERGNFHVTNVCKCYPSLSRTPTPQQISICSQKWLFEELREIDCKLVLAFGNTAVKALVNKTGGITEMSGKTEWVEGVGAWVCWCMHPSAVLHNPNNSRYFHDGIKNFVDKIDLLNI